MIEVQTFAAQGHTCCQAAQQVREQVQAWLNREGMHPSEILDLQASTSSCADPDPGTTAIIHSYTLTLLLHRLVPVITTAPTPAPRQGHAA